MCVLLAMPAVGEILFLNQRCKLDNFEIVLLCGSPDS